jgi:hypothetical protein
VALHSRMVEKRDENGNGHAPFAGELAACLPPNQEWATPGGEDAGDSFRRLNQEAGGDASQHCEQPAASLFGNGTPVTALGRVESWGGVSSQYLSRRSADELNLDHFNQAIKKENVLRAGLIEKKGNGHAGTWKTRDFYLHDDSISFSRLRGETAIDVIHFEELSG